MAHRKHRWSRGAELPEASDQEKQQDDELTAQPSSSTGGMGLSFLSGAERQPYVFDMETGDPDDVMTLLLMAAHPAVDLRAVTVTPGSMEQVALVRWVLQQVHLPDVRIGAQEWPANAKKSGCIQGRFYDCFKRAPTGTQDCEDAAFVLRQCCDESTTLVTGGPLHNLGAALSLKGFQLGRWVAQGGFAGEGVVPPELQMEKFVGKATCPTWNFNGNVEAAESALASKAIGRKVLVSKNVCHRVVYDMTMHTALGDSVSQAHGSARRCLELLHSAMDKYLQRKSEGKKMHDPLAFATAIDESVCRLEEVELYRERGGWGSRLSPQSGVWISVDYDPLAFRRALLPWLRVRE